MILEVQQRSNLFWSSEARLVSTVVCVHVVAVDVDADVEADANVAVGHPIGRERGDERCGTYRHLNCTVVTKKPAEL